MAETADASLDGLRLRLAPAIARAAGFDGWGDEALSAAAKEQDLDPAVARLAFPGGAMDMISAWVASVDAAMEERFGSGALDGQKIRDKIRDLVWFRLE